MKTSIILLLVLLGSPFAKAADYAYFGFEPSIVTNYVAVKKKMGYVRLTVELMIEDASNYDIVEHHAPLLRDAIINIIGQKPEAELEQFANIKTAEVGLSTAPKATSAELAPKIFQVDRIEYSGGDFSGSAQDIRSEASSKAYLTP